MLRKRRMIFIRIPLQACVSSLLLLSPMRGEKARG